MPSKLALGVRETVAGRGLGALEVWGGGGYLPPFRCIAGAACCNSRPRQGCGDWRPGRGRGRPWLTVTSSGGEGDGSLGSFA